MRRCVSIYRWLLTVWIMLLCFASPSVAYDRVGQPGIAERPTYQFRSTSPYAPSIGPMSTFTPLVDNPYAGTTMRPGLRKGGNPWDEDPGDDDNPIGVVDDPAPLGDVAWIVIVLCTVLYSLRKWRSNTKKSHVPSGA